MSKITALLPLYNGIKYIDESIRSIQAQTFSDWELLIVNDFGSDDGCAEIVLHYAEHDPRIRLVQNKKRLGLAESLNAGIRLASGNYIARVDADDPSYPKRFEKQADYLDKHPDVFLCGALQRSVLPDRNYVLQVPTDTEELKAALLFGCEISHCSVMFRRDDFVREGMYYDSNQLGEDFDLWTRIMFDHKIVNLPEVLVDHRWGFENISLGKGDALVHEVRQINARTLRTFDLNIPEKDLILLSGWRNKPEEYAVYNKSVFLTKQSDLLQTLYTNNLIKKRIDPDALRKIIWKRWNWVCECCHIFYQDISCSDFTMNAVSPKVSIIMPVYQAVETLRETIDSIMEQEFCEWELLMIFEPDDSDGGFALAQMYAFMDSRIRLIVNHEPLGMAESLNEGIRQAKSDYIARIDADDLANAKRIGTQYYYMENHPDVGICQTYQHYFGSGRNDFIHQPPLGAEEMKAKLLFFCDACHSTVMFRKSLFEKIGLFYAKDAALEDYELWTRAVQHTAFVTIPEVYGEYRISTHNVSLEKMEAIEKNMCEIIRRQLKIHLDIDVPDKYVCVLNGWNNIFVTLDVSHREELLTYLQGLLHQIWNSNLQRHSYNRPALLQSIAAKWRWSKYNEPWQGMKNVSCIEDAIELPYSKTRKPNITIKKAARKGRNRIKNAVRKSLHVDQFFQNIDHRFQYWSDVHRNQTKEVVDEEVQKWTWKRQQSTKQLLEEIRNQNIQIQNSLAQLSYQQNMVPHYKGEKIRIVFLFQIASFWPSWESLYQECIADERMDVHFLFLDETATEDVQMESAFEFLNTSDIRYERFEEFDLEKFRPHIMVIQTPYDEWHRHREHWSFVFRSQGIRLVYIPYGIEISDTEDSHQLHFHTTVIDNCWRIYTFSERMRKDYLKHALNRNAVRALGLPRFDGLYHKENFVLDVAIRKKSAGRKIVLWKLHFPKTIYEQGMELTVTPPLQIYIEFARSIQDYKDFFFIFMPHPRFRSKKNNQKVRDMSKALFDMVTSCENTFLDERDDYRESLINADYIIVDRSAVMVEAGALGVPVLYMYNEKSFEPFTEAIEPLMKSYYQGTSASDMRRFLDMCRDGLDPKREERMDAFHRCIPYFDGQCGARIKDDMIRDLENNIL